MSRFPLALVVASVVALFQLSTRAQEFNLQDFLVEDQSSELSADQTSFDKEEWKIPENASVDELLALLNRFKKYQETTRKQTEESLDFLEFSTTLLLNLSTRLLDSELSYEQFAKAAETKYEALRMKAKLEEKEPTDAERFINDLLENATDEERALFAFVLKFNAIVDANKDPDPKLKELSDIALNRPEEKIKAFGALVRYSGGRLLTQELLGVKVRFIELAYAKEEFEFYEKIVDDETYPLNVRETAFKAKIRLLFIALLNLKIDRKKALDEGVEEKAQRLAASMKPVKEDFDRFFKRAVEEPRSLDLRKYVYYVYLWESPLYAPEDEEKTARQELAISYLKKENERELRDQVVFFENNRLLEKVQMKLRPTTAFLAKYGLVNADEQTLSKEEQEKIFNEHAEILYDRAKITIESVDDSNPERIANAVLLRGWADLLKNEPDAAIAKVDEFLRNRDDVSASVQADMTALRAGAIIRVLQNDVERFEEFEEYVYSLLENDRTRVDGEAAIIVKTLELFDSLDEKKAGLDEFKNAIDAYKRDVELNPTLVALYPNLRDSIQRLGTTNDKPKLFSTTARELADFFTNSKNPETIFAKNFFTYFATKAEQEEEEEEEEMEEETTEYDYSAYREYQEFKKEEEEEEKEGTVDLDDAFDKETPLE